MKPYFTDSTGTITIYHADAREALPSLHADAVVTDPPYGLGFRGEAWDERVPSWWLPLARAAAPLVVFTTAPTTLWDYPRPDWVACWVRRGSTARATSGGFNHWSPIAIYGALKLPHDLLDVPDCPNEKAREKWGHPSPKPLRLMRRILGAVDAPCVLDPFAGSGSTLVAAKLEGRRAIGIEIEERYCEIAARRLQQEVLQFT